jgi:hypothetical protein
MVCIILEYLGIVKKYVISVPTWVTREYPPGKQWKKG